MGEKYQIRKPAILFAILEIVVIEYYMIVVETYPNFQDAYGFTGGFFIYVMVSVLSLGFLKLLFSRIDGTRFLQTFLMTFTFVVLVGLFWSYYTGYVNPQLLDPAWQFTHDFPYVALVTQFIAMAILLLGTKQSEPIKKEKNKEKDEWEDF